MLKLKPHLINKTKFDNDLEKSLLLVSTMGEQVEKQLFASIELLSETDKELIEKKATEIIASDKKINALEITISDACILLITKYIPKATDLRLIISILRTSSELERIGDTVIKICNTAKVSSNVNPELIDKIQQYAKKSVEVLNLSMKALSEMDVKLAAQTYQNDSNLNAVYYQILSELQKKASEDVSKIESYVNTIITLKQIERIGDRSKNICEFVYYYVHGIVGNKELFNTVK